VANPGAIYPLLTLLEKENFIEGKWRTRTGAASGFTPLPHRPGGSGADQDDRDAKADRDRQVLQEFIADLQSELRNPRKREK